MKLLMEAQMLVEGTRKKEYGDPSDNFSLIAKRWEMILGVEISTWQVAAMMIDLKIARLCGPGAGYKRDTAVDIAGYASLMATLAEGTDGS